jgi:hypothetical protein
VQCCATLSEPGSKNTPQPQSAFVRGGGSADARPSRQIVVCLPQSIRLELSQDLLRSFRPAETTHHICHGLSATSFRSSCRLAEARTGWVTPLVTLATTMTVRPHSASGLIALTSAPLLRSFYRPEHR